MDWMHSWWMLVIVLVVVGGTFTWLIRSLNRWPQTPPRDPESVQAEARLWNHRDPGDL